MIYTVPWAPVIALSVVLLLFLVVPLVAAAALVTLLLALASALVAGLALAALAVPPLLSAAIRRGLPRLRLARPRPPVRARRSAAVSDVHLDRLR